MILGEVYLILHKITCEPFRNKKNQGIKRKLTFKEHHGSIGTNHINREPCIKSKEGGKYV